MVRRAQEHQLTQQRRPALSGFARHVCCRARHQPTHAVAQDGDALQRHRPGRHQPLQLGGKLAAVLRHMAPAVVAQANQRAAQRLGQECTVVVAVARPLRVVHAQTVDQQQQVRARHGAGRWFQLLFEDVGLAQREGLTIDAHLHRLRQRVASGHQPITHHTVERGQHRLALRRSLRVCGGIVQQRQQRTQHHIRALPHQRRHAANAPVNLPGEAVGLLGWRATREPQLTVYRAMHTLHHVDHALGRLRRELGGGLEIGGAKVAQQGARLRAGWLVGGGGHGPLWLRWRGQGWPTRSSTWLRVPPGSPRTWVEGPVDAKRHEPPTRFGGLRRDHHKASTPRAQALTARLFFSTMVRLEGLGRGKRLLCTCSLCSTIFHQFGSGSCTGQKRCLSSIDAPDSAIDESKRAVVCKIGFEGRLKPPYFDLSSRPRQGFCTTFNFSQMELPKEKF